MLKSECVYLLNFINKNSYSGYFVEDILNIVSEFPPYYNVDENRVKELLEILKGLGYISIKYNDGEKVCITSTDKGILYLESVSEKGVNINYKKLYLLTFLGGAIGGILGGIIAKILILIVGI